MKRGVFAAGILAIFLALLIIRLTTAAPPIPPYRPYGTVKLDGENVALGTIIEAYCGVDPIPYGTAGTIEESGDSFYAAQVLADDPDTPSKDGCAQGDSVSFTIDNPDGDITANETSTWVSGLVDEVNLTGEKPRPEIGIKKLVNEQDVSSEPGLFILAGEAVTWTYTISNTGNVALSNVVLADDNGTPGAPGDDETVCTFATLDPRAAQVCELTNTAIAGQYTNQATVTADYTQTISAVDNSYYFGAVIAIDVEKLTNDHDADMAPGVYLDAGQPVTWTYSISNTGNVALTNIDVTDDQLGGTVCTVASLAPGDPPLYCTATGTAEAGQYANIATAAGDGPVGLPGAEDSDPSHYFGIETRITLLKKTNGEDADTPPGPYLLAGDSVNWSYTVHNDGNVLLTNIQVSDNLVPSIDCRGVSELVPGGQMTCTATGTAVEGPYMNIGTVAGTPPGDLDVVTDTNPSHYFGASTQIQIEKHTNGQDADEPPGPYIPVTMDPEGRITWTYMITNTGNVTVTNLVVTDNRLPPEAIQCSGGGQLGPGESIGCEAFGNSGDNEPGQYSNLATVQASPIGGLEVISDTDSSHYVGAAPAIRIEKHTNGQDADMAPGPYIPIIPTPAPITWIYVITNQGTVTLTEILVSDDQPSIDVQCPVIDELGVGQSFSCEAYGVAEEGQYVNVAMVEATPVGGLATVSDTDASHYFGTRPLVSLEKSTNGQDADTGTGPIIIVGRNVTWTYAIANAGNVTITVDSLVDDQGALSDCVLPFQLGPGEQIVCRAYDVAEEGQYGNVGRVEATPIGNLAVISDSDASHYYGANPTIAVEKHTNGQDADSATGPYIPVGAAVLWTYVISNTGNVQLEDIMLVDDNGTLGDPSDDYECSVGMLAAGAKDNTTCQQSLPGGAVAGQQSNLVSVSGLFESVTAEAADPSHYFGVLSGINLEKHTNDHDADGSPGPFILVGDPVTWTYVVTNTGNVNLANVTITDDGGTPSNPADHYSCNFAELLPAIPRSCQAVGSAMEGQFSSQASVVGTPPGGLPNVSDTDNSHYFGSYPAIDLEKYTNNVDAVGPPGPYVLSGEPVVWTYVMTNTGNVTVTIVSVSDDQGLTVNCPGQTALAPDESATCQASGTAGSGQYSNIGAVVAAPPGDLDGIGDSDTSYYFGAVPGIDLKKLTNDQSVDNGPVPYILVGDTVTWTFIITNTGNVTLTDIIVTDDNGTPGFDSDDIVSDDLGPLPAQAVTSYMFTSTARSGSYVNIGTAIAKPLVGDDVSASSGSRYFGTIIDLDIKKLTNGEDAQVAPGPVIEAGSPVTWTYFISVSGNVTLSNVVVKDDNGTPEDPGDDFTVCEFGPLSPGDPVVTCTATETALPGQYGNRGTVIGSPPGTLAEISDFNDSHYFGFVSEPRVQVEKLVNGQDADSAPGLYVSSGQALTWTYTVYNIGNAPLSAVQVMDDNGTPGNLSDDFEACSFELLEPFGYGSCMVHRTAVEGPFTNVAKVSAIFEDGDTKVNDEDAAHYFGVTIALSIEKLTNGFDADEPPGVSLEPGDIVTWTYIVSNGSNVMLTEVMIWDDNGSASFLGDDFVVCSVGDLPSGANVSCQHLGLAIDGAYANVGTVYARSPLLATESSSDSSHYITIMGVYLPWLENQ